MPNGARQLALALPTLPLRASVCFAQMTPGEKYPRGIPAKPESAETNAVNMELVRELMREWPNPDGVIILIARLGRGETGRRLSRRRLHNVESATSPSSGSG